MGERRRSGRIGFHRGERTRTEGMVDDALRRLGYFDDPDTVVVEKQQSAIEEIRKALAKASKTGKDKGGVPGVHHHCPGYP